MKNSQFKKNYENLKKLIQLAAISDLEDELYPKNEHEISI